MGGILKKGRFSDTGRSAKASIVSSVSVDGIGAGNFINVVSKLDGELDRFPKTGTVIYAAAFRGRRGVYVPGR